MDIYLLQHSRETESGEDIKVIGLYSSEVAAQAAVKRLASQPGFCSYPDGFHVDRYQVDVDHWSEGFDGVP